MEEEEERLSKELREIKRERVVFREEMKYVREENDRMSRLEDE